MESHALRLTRRQMLGACAGGAAVLIGSAGCGRSPLCEGPPGSSPVAILRASSYSADLLDRMLRGAAACGLDARGKRVLLKPNLGEFERGGVIHTAVEGLAAAVAR